MRRLSNLIRDEKAVSAVEYGLIISLIVVAMIAGLRGVAGSTTTMWNNISDAVQKAR